MSDSDDDLLPFLGLLGLILILAAHLVFCFFGFLFGVCGSSLEFIEPSGTLITASRFGFSLGRLVPCIICGGISAGGHATRALALCLWNGATAVEENSESALRYLARSTKIMLVGSSLSMICMLVAITSPWVVLRNSSRSPTQSTLYLWPFGGQVCLSPAPGCKSADIFEILRTFYPIGEPPKQLTLAVGSFDKVSKISSSILVLSFLSQFLAFIATIRAWDAVRGRSGANRTFAREACMNLNAVTFLMMIFSTSSYATAFSEVTSALNTSYSEYQPGMSFAFLAALLSFFSLVIVAIPRFRKAWRSNAAGGATAPLLVVTVAAPSSSSAGLEKSLPGHLERELLEVAEGKATECPICLDKITTATGTYTKCGHLFCKECVQKLKQDKSRCPACRGALM